MRSLMLLLPECRAEACKCGERAAYARSPLHVGQRLSCRGRMLDTAPAVDSLRGIRSSLGHRVNRLLILNPVCDAEAVRETSHQFPNFSADRVENARSVRKNPQDSGLVKLRARKVFERQSVTFGFGPR